MNKSRAEKFGDVMMIIIFVVVPCCGLALGVIDLWLGPGWMIGVAR